MAVATSEIVETIVGRVFFDDKSLFSLEWLKARLALCHPIASLHAMVQAQVIPDELRDLAAFLDDESHELALFWSKLGKKIDKDRKEVAQVIMAMHDVAYVGELGTAIGSLTGKVEGQISLKTEKS